MAFDQDLASRIRSHLAARGDVEEKRMFGGLCFMVAGRMACGVAGSELMLRLGKRGAAQAATEPHARYCDFVGKPMLSMITVAPAGFAGDAALAGWIDRAVACATSDEDPPVRRRRARSPS
ncbi:MAG: TfoX/Sxy family protein [Alphaproteobacteria bacterium]